MANQEIEREILLVVEGWADKAFLMAFVTHLGFGDRVQVIVCGGKQGMRPQLKALTNTPKWDIVQSVGIFRDADASHEGAVRSIRSALEYCDLATPAGPEEVEGTQPRTGYFVFPGGGRPGELEDICLDSLGTSEAMFCVNHFMLCAEIAGNVIKSRSKSKLRAYLSIQEDPELHLGTAAEKGVFDWSVDAFTPLSRFLHALCSIS